jgi:hypothetical protein
LLSSSALELYVSPAPTITPTIAPTIAPTSTYAPTTSQAAFNVVINNLVTNHKWLNFAEVQLFNNGVQIPRESLSFSLSSTYDWDTPASNCNDGLTNSLCHSQGDESDPNPTLTIVSAEAFDKVVVYNREGDCCRDRIEGATITTTVSGISKATTFPFSPDFVFTFLLSSSGLQLYVPPAPTIVPTSAPTTTEAAFNVVINNLVSNDKILNLAEVQLFNNGVQVPIESLSFSLSSTYEWDTPASNCNDGNTDSLCISGTADPNPTLTIVSAEAFDMVVVYNRYGAYNSEVRIEGATITATVSGISKATTFPFSPEYMFTFLLSSSGLELYVPPVK